MNVPRHHHRIIAHPLLRAVYLFTICVSVADVLPSSLAFPAKTAVKERRPAASVLVENVTSLASTISIVPRVFVPSIKLTVPVTGPPCVSVTVALRVTVSSEVDGLGEDPSADADADVSLTVWVSTSESLPATLALPA